MTPHSTSTLFLLLFLFVSANATKPCYWLGEAPTCYLFTPFTCPSGTTEIARASDATNNRFADFGDSICLKGEKTLCCNNEILRLKEGVTSKHCEGGFTKGCPAGRIEIAVERSGFPGLPTTYTSFCCEKERMVLEKLPEEPSYENWFEDEDEDGLVFF